MGLKITDVQKVALKVAFVDAAGNPASVDGPPVWGTSDPNILAVTADANDPFSATAVAQGPLGSAQVNVQADAQLGEGTKTITGTLDIEVTASEATTPNITAGTPEPK